MKSIISVFICVVVVAVAINVPQSKAAVIPRPGSGDPHIQMVTYSPDEVVLLRATLGYQTLIAFAPGERIENVAIGDSLGWQITPNRKANLLFVKPMNHVPVTNMTVVTNLRYYAFELSVRPGTALKDDLSIVYTLRFEYPEPAVAVVEPEEPTPPPAPPPPPEVVNDAYSYEGSVKTVPTRVFDDHHATYFQFREGEEYPAIFSVDADGGEVVVNSSQRGSYVVVDQIARGFVLRQGSEVTHLYNDGFRESEPGPQSPKPRPKSCWICL